MFHLGRLIGVSQVEKEGRGPPDRGGTDTQHKDMEELGEVGRGVLLRMAGGGDTRLEEQIWVR